MLYSSFSSTTLADFRIKELLLIFLAFHHHLDLILLHHYAESRGVFIDIAITSS
jgi:hypothetical protein